MSLDKIGSVMAVYH